MPANPLARQPPDGAGVRRLVITGASSGLGRELAITYAAPKIEMLLLGRNESRLHEAAARCRTLGAAVQAAVADVTDREAMSAVLQAFAAAGPVDLLVANAGVLRGPPSASELDGLEAAAEQISTNLLGVVYAVETLAPAMIARGAGQIAIVSSTASYRGLPYMPAYSASKAGVRAYGEAIRARLAPLGVCVSVITPSFFESPMTDAFQGAKPMILSLAEATRRVRAGLDRGAARIVFPRRMALLLQLIDLLPGRFGDRLLQADAKIGRPAAADAT